jgi:alpha-N-acetylglucosamine transferase
VPPIAVGCQPSHVDSWNAVGYTKLNLWNLTQYDKIVYINADAIAVRNVDELFDRPGVPLSAAPDVFPPDRFNAGVLVVTPDAAVFKFLMARRDTLPSYDGGDTGEDPRTLTVAFVVCVCVCVC